MKFQAESGGYRLRSYPLARANVPLPADLAGQRRTLARATINENLPRETRHRGKPGNDRMEFRY